VLDCAFPLSNFCGQDTVSAVIESHTFCIYGSKNVVNEAKTLPGLKYLPVHGSLSNSGHVQQQQLVSRRFAALFTYVQWSAVNSARSVSHSAWVMSDGHFITECICGHAFCILY
jgi:hypothetical protein